jgi:hypothetical protein
MSPRPRWVRATLGTRVAFYSFNGTHVPTLAALARAKPRGVSVRWFVHAPWKGFTDSVEAAKLVGAKFQVVGDDWLEEIGRWGPDAVLICSLYEDTDQLARLGVPIFFHEYGNTAKWDSTNAAVRFGDTFSFVRTVFTYGEVAHYMSRDLPTELVLTGGTRSDFYFAGLPCEQRRRGQFILYCNTYWQGEEMRERPRRWTRLLSEACARLHYDLVVKLHPCTLAQLNLAEDVRGELDTRCYYADLLKQATAVVSDPGTLLVESFLADRPTFMPRIEGESWWRLDLLRCGAIELEPELETLVEQLRTGIKQDPKRHPRRMLAKLWWHQPDGHVSERLWRELLKRI